MAFATAEDLATYMGRDFSAEETATATQALDIATATIQNYTGQKLTAVTDETVTVPRVSTTLVLLPEIPVNNVDSVTDDGELLVFDEDYIWHSSGVIHRLTGGFTRSVVVQYDHGYTTIPDDIKGACLSIAARLFTSSGQNVTTESLGMYRVSYGGADFSPEERQVLGRYRAPLIA
jgi:hypothetical protein